MSIGSFLSQDPLGYAAGLNYYAYVGNDPISNFDPDGREGFPADAEFRAAPPPPAPIPVNFKTVSTVIMSAAGQAFVGTTAGLSNQLAPNNGDAQSVQAGWQMVQSNMAQSAGIDPNNPRFQLATTTTAVIGTFGTLRSADSSELVEQPLRELTPDEAATYARVSKFRAGVRDQIKEQGRADDGTYRDPSGMEIKPGDPWEAGHLPEYKLDTWQRIAADQNWTRNDWLDFQNNPGIYRPELPWSNASHEFENGDWQDPARYIRKYNQSDDWSWSGAATSGKQCHF